ncbi:MAG: hypothetical protein G01um101416_782 [Microgenomates group bacterium Gr01-1014_16]|nr:MAG: hypothetical protein G01um101416_782 [Microgenomates group bacterium Gr01-1014_16]
MVKALACEARDGGSTPLTHPIKYQILIPSGELEKEVLAFLNQAEFDVTFSSRCYKTEPKSLPNEFVIVRAASIPEILSNPLFSTVLGGFTGSDILWENGWLQKSVTLPIPSPSKLFLGAISNVNSLDQLINSTIATKYPNIAKEYFRKLNIPVNIFPIPGKDEALPYLSNQIKAIVGIRKTGNTPLANKLKILQEISPCTINWIERSGNFTQLKLFKQKLGLCS